MKPAGLDADDGVDLDVGERGEQLVDRPVEGGRVGEQRRDVPEPDARLREVRDLAHQPAQPVGVQRGLRHDVATHGRSVRSAVPPAGRPIPIGGTVLGEG